MEVEKNVFEYLDYRAYLEAHLEERKARNPRFSRRWVALRIGCDPAYLHRVLKGDRNLSEDHALRAAELMEFGKREKEYWELLVRYGRARNFREKSHCLDALNHYRRAHAKQTPSHQYEMYRHWYYVVLREMIHAAPPIRSRKELIAILAGNLVPRVKLSEVTEAVDILESLRVIQMDTDGVYRLSDALITTGEAIPPEIVNRVLVEFLERARESLERFPREQRAVSALTVSVSAAKAERIKERLAEFRREIMKLVEEDDPDLDRVYHLSMHFFPVSLPLGGTHGSKNKKQGES